MMPFWCTASAPIVLRTRPLQAAIELPDEAWCPPTVEIARGELKGSHRPQEIFTTMRYISDQIGAKNPKTEHWLQNQPHGTLSPDTLD